MIIQFPILNISLSTLSSLDLEETHIGDFDSYGSDPRRIQYAGSETDGLSVDYKVKYAGQLQVIKDNYATFAVPYNGEDNNDYVDGKGFCCNDGSLEAAKTRALARAAKNNFQEGDAYEKMQFYYHPDHLGSSSYITNLDGEVVQHIEYVPFGEVFIEERNNIWNTPYLFNAKEFDKETGLYYYGARYYDPHISLWITTDPIKNKYPNISSYCYTANNPVRFIEPDGRIIKLPKGTTSEQIFIVLGNIQKLTDDKVVFSTQKDGSVRIKIASLGKGNKSAGTRLIRRINSSKRIMTINIISEKEEGNFETDDNPTNAINGKGSNVNVHFNPESNPDIPTLNRKTGRVGNKKRPSQVGLAHEMIHGDRSMRGVAIEYSESEFYSYMNNRGQRVMETLSKEEAATVGLNHVKKNDITENDIRKDQGLNPRGAY